jgi:hypothetical protein
MSMKDREYFKAKEAIKKDCEHKLRALDTTWTVMNGTPPPKQAPATTRRKSANGENGESLATALLEVIADMPDEFNTTHVVEILRKLRPEFPGSNSTVTHTLKRMANSKSPPIAIKETGKGKRPTTYRKVAKEAATVDLNDL